MPCRAGELRDRVTIQSKTTVADGQGGRTTTWGTLDTVWARVSPVRTAERLQAAAIGALQAYQVTIRSRSDVTTAMRLSWTPFRAGSAKTLEIHGVTPLDGGRSFLLLDCAEVV
jgi:SPP1 family predicted phage head-tail adaptor